MDIIRINSKISDKKNIQLAVRTLKRGGVVMYPTDTAYGLAADTKSRQGIEKIFKIKGRMKSKALPLIAGSLSMANRYVKWTPIGKKLAQKFWPGPLTLVLETRNLNLVSQRAGRHIVHNGKIAIRVPDNKIAQMISKKLGRPITSTSANISGQPECYSAAEFLNQAIGQKFLPDLILDAGPLKKRKPSTIVDATVGSVKVVREGTIKMKK